jgi:RNA polymerase sigma-70 factor (ECF subfamily)
MNSARAHDLSLCVRKACPQRRSKLSTTPYNPDEVNVPAARVPSEEGLITAGPNAGDSRGSQLLSRARLHGGNCALVHAELSEDDLIAAAQRGDQKAFVDLCGRHSGVTRTKIFSIVRNHVDAKDALQDTLLRAYTHPASFRRSCTFATWLTAIGVNSALMIFRKRRVRGETSATTRSLETGTGELQEFVDRSPGPEAIYLKQQAILLVRREVEKLLPILRSAVNHYYGAECSLEEADKAQEISLCAAKSRLSRGRGELRCSLERYGIFTSRN